MAASVILISALAMAFSASQTKAVCPAHPQTSAGVIAAENEWVHAIESRDVKALSCILAPEFSDSNWRGEEISRSIVLDRLPSRPESTLKLSGLSAFVVGRFAIVRGINTQTARAGGNSGSVRFTDVFVYRSGQWRAVSAQETLVAQ